MVITVTTTALAPAERYYTAHTYLLPSDEEERLRQGVWQLYRQHKMLKTDLAWESIPSDLHLKTGDKILDAGTGSGTWAIDMANSVPEGVEITGIDIEKKLFPSPVPNARFLVQSSLDLPKEWSSTFSLIHQRLMVCAFTEDAWNTNIAGFYRCLKPGGQIQLLEIDILRVMSDHLPTPPLTTQWMKALHALCKARNIGPHAIVDVPDILKKVGFEDTQTRKQPMYQNGEAGKAARYASLGSQRALKVPFLKAGGFGIAQTPAEFDTFMDQMEEEWATYEFAWLWIGWTAKKPVY
ncbi:S-adenosyl-L-methionine-dependent methyltransferase [Dacryopinax primogenitus]|uniref:S-adenosyl-L-methionine-dependent methyltransferase n=1 Tax=Dacryopinax primogenitus (strain DJM 731) TaxID=1858805 RepID=M5G8H9_DACPD|nr:S-adenosyl-L-methionine-dependent methyltransferase [Dacryopinax primogenitus]EJU06521.1 S-adenosyl-L-methionine-dependent methyltransferase [Dacryopinax primogenitus]